MPAFKRNKTSYRGVFFIEDRSSRGKPVRIYYIMYRKEGRLIEEKAGSFGMTAAKAARLRAQKIEGKLPTNREKREGTIRKKEAEGNRWTFDRLWETYKEAKPDLKGIATDENRYRKHIQPVFGDKTPMDLIPLEVDRVRLRLLKTRKPQTVKNVLALLRRLIHFGIKKRLCTEPGFKFSMPKVDNQKTEDLSPDQLNRLLAVLDEYPNVQVASLMKMALYTGMRRGELFRLRWEDIDFERGFIQIREPKGGSSQKIPLNEPTRKLLCGHPRTRSPYVFPGRDGGPRREAKRALNEIKSKAELPEDFRPLHGLRHVYASMLASSGKVDMYTLQKLLTHKSPAMTQRYAHLRDEALRQASELAGDIIQKHAKKRKAGSVTRSG